MRHSESLDQIAPALVKARLAMPSVHKDQTNSFYSNKYATLGAIVAAALPALLAHGIQVIQSGGLADEAGAEVVTRLQHLSGQWIETTLWLPIVGQKIKGGGVEPISPQSAGSSHSYGRRYGLAAALCIVADEDDDGEEASKGARGQTATARATPRSAPSAPPAPRSAVKSEPVATGIPSACPKCGGPLWDNSDPATKKSPKGPDWACKDKSCKDPLSGYVTAGWIAKAAPPTNDDFDSYPDSLRDAPDDLPF